MASILVVEGDVLVRQLVGAVLSNAGHRVRSASNGREGLMLSREQPPDLILTEARLPVASGLDLLRTLRADMGLRNVPVVMLTARANRGDVLTAVELGVSGFLLKEQCELRRLLAEVDRALMQRRPGPGEDIPADAGAARPAPTPEPRVAPPPAAPAAPARPTGPGPQSAGAPDRSRGDALRDVKPVVPRTELLEKITAAGELRALSPALANVLKLTRSAGASTDTVAKAIRCDHAIALKIVKLANSAAATRGEPVSSVRNAVVRLGIEQVRQAVLNIAVIDRFSATQADGCLNAAHFWEHAIATGVVASELARGRGQGQAEVAFTIGLLHDVGRLIMAEALGPVYAGVVRFAREHRLPLEQVEKRMLLLTHAEIMEAVLRRWQLPRDLVEPIVLHELSAATIRSTAPTRATDAMTAALANRVAHAMLLGCSGNRVVYPIEELCEALRVSETLIRRIEGMVRQETDDIKFALLADSDAGSWTPLDQELRDAIGSPIRTLFVSASPGVDAFRLFTERLDDPALERPTLAVVHFRHARERAALSRELLAAEDRAGVRDLPTVVISPGAAVAPEDAVLVTRPCAALPEPLMLDAFVESVRSLLGAARPAAQAA